MATQTTMTNGSAVEALRAEVTELRAELAELRASLAAEVRTRRLVVLDAQGREAVYTDERQDSIELCVECRHGEGEDDTVRAALHADAESNDGGSSAVILESDGYVFA